MKDFAKIREKFLIEQGKYQTLISEKERKEERLIELSTLRENKDKVRILYGKAGENQKNQIRHDIEEIVTNALQYIMQEEIRFIIQPNETRGRIEFEFLVETIRDGKKDTTQILGGRGDGVSDIVDLALSVALYSLSNNKGPLVLDEPTKQASKELLPNIGEFLQEISHTLGIQIIFITHHRDTLAEYGDKRYLVSLNGNKSIVEEI